MTIAITETEFTKFLFDYLDQVKKLLPESYRARQLKAGGIEAGLVIDFETRFLKIPVEKVFAKGVKLGRELELKRIEEDIETLKTFIAGKHRFWKCKCGGWHYGEVYKCPLELERERIREELLVKAKNGMVKWYQVVEVVCGKKEKVRFEGTICKGFGRARRR